MDDQQDHEICRLIIDTMEQQHVANIRALRIFIVDQLDKYLTKKSEEFASAFLNRDEEALAKLRTAAHELVDSAMKYKLEELERQK